MVLVSGRTLVGPASLEVVHVLLLEVQADLGHRDAPVVVAAEDQVPDQCRVGGLTEGWCMQIDPAITGTVPTTTTRCTTNTRGSEVQGGRRSGITGRGLQVDVAPPSPAPSPPPPLRHFHHCPIAPPDHRHRPHHHRHHRHHLHHNSTTTTTTIVSNARKHSIARGTKHRRSPPTTSPSCRHRAPGPPGP